MEPVQPRRRLAGERVAQVARPRRERPESIRWTTAGPPLSRPQRWQDAVRTLCSTSRMNIRLRSTTCRPVSRSPPRHRSWSRYARLILSNWTASGEHLVHERPDLFPLRDPKKYRCRSLGQSGARMVPVDVHLIGSSCGGGSGAASPPLSGTCLRRLQPGSAGRRTRRRHGHGRSRSRSLASSSATRASASCRA